MSTEIIRFDNQQTMSSIEIADATGKQHAHVMRDVRKLIDKINRSTSGLVNNRFRNPRGKSIS